LWWFSSLRWPQEELVWDVLDKTALAEHIEVEQDPQKRLSNGRYVLRRASVERQIAPVPVLCRDTNVGSPANVHYMSIQNFCNFCDRLKQLDGQDIRDASGQRMNFILKDRLGLLKDYVCIQDRLESEDDFQSRFRRLVDGLRDILKEYLQPFDKQKPIRSAFSTGKPDDLIRLDDGTDECLAILVCEAQRPSYFGNDSRDLTTRYCDFDCTMHKHEHDHSTWANTHDRFEHEGHIQVSPIRQLYNYMLINGLYFGLLYSFNHYAGFIRDCSGNLTIIEIVRSTDTVPAEPVSAMQFLIMWIHLSYLYPNGFEARHKFPNFNVCTHHDCEKRHLPMHAAQHGKYLVPGNMNLGAADTEMASLPSSRSSEYFPSNRLPVFFADSLNRVVHFCDFYFEGWKAGDDFKAIEWARLQEQTGLLKYMDLAKPADLGEYLIEPLRTELQVYKALEKEQGFAIPKVYGGGMMADMIFGGIFLEDVGNSLEMLEDKAISDAWMRKAVIALDRIHDLGVLHGNLDDTHILIDEKTGDPKLVGFSHAKFKKNMTVDEWRVAVEEEKDTAREILESYLNRDTDL